MGAEFAGHEFIGLFCATSGCPSKFATATRWSCDIPSPTAFIFPLSRAVRIADCVINRSVSGHGARVALYGA
jgi:hypothetical protein